MDIALWRRRVGTARRLQREAGARAVGFRLLQRLHPVLHLHPEWFLVMGYGLDPSGPAAGTVAGVTILRGTDPAALVGLGHPEDLIRGRLERGDLCVAAVDDEGLAGFVWYRRGIYDEQGILFEMAPHEAWGYDLMVAERRRGQGLSAVLVRAAGDVLRREGVVRVVAAIDAVNTPALRGSRTRGAREVGRVELVRAGRISVRREAWEGGPARWSVYRDERNSGRPVGAGAEG